MQVGLYVHEMSHYYADVKKDDYDWTGPEGGRMVWNADVAQLYEDIGRNTTDKKSVKFANGSHIKAASTTKKSGVGKALSLLIIDECLEKLTNIYIRNKLTGEVKSVKIGELYESNEYK